MILCDSQHNVYVKSVGKNEKKLISIGGISGEIFCYIDKI